MTEAAAKKLELISHNTDKFLKQKPNHETGARF